MINPSSFLCLPIDFRGKVFVFPPTVKEVVGNPKFPLFHSVLTSSQEDIEDGFIERFGNQEFDLPTPFQYLLENSQVNKDFEKLVKESFFFFTHKTITFFYEQRSILIGSINTELISINDLSQLVFLEEEEFFDFQNIVRAAVGDKSIEPYNPDEDPRIRKIKAKARLREKVKAKTGKGIDLGTSLASLCCMGIGITPLNVKDMSYAAIHILMTTYQEKEKYQMEINSMTLGFGSNKKIKPKNWIRKLEDL